MGSYPCQRPVALHHSSCVQPSGRTLGTWEAELGSERKEFAVELLQQPLEQKPPALWTGTRVLEQTLWGLQV